MAQVAQRIATALRELGKCDGVNILMNNEDTAGQKVFYAHMHVIPRFLNDEAYQPEKHIPYDSEAGKEIAQLLATKLN